MSTVDQTLIHACRRMACSKVTVRRAACNEVSDIFNNFNSVKYLYSNKFPWISILKEIARCLLMDSERNLELYNKKGQTNVSMACEVFQQYIKLCTAENAEMDTKKLSFVIIDLLEKQCVRKFNTSFLIAIVNNLFESPRTRNFQTGPFLESLFKIIKSSINSREFENCRHHLLKCLMHIIKNGPLYGMSFCFLKREFPFMLSLRNCLERLTMSDSKLSIVEAIYSFCEHNAMDCRKNCCKLGESTIPVFISFYEVGGREEPLKLVLIDYFLLQCAIHNPKGVHNSERTACAFSENAWKSCIRDIFVLLYKDLSRNLETQRRNRNIFITENGCTTILGTYVDLFVETCYQLFSQDICIEVLHDNMSMVPTKRQKVQTNFATLIELLQESKEWPWIVMIDSYLETYGASVGRNDLLILLKVLSNLQVDCQDFDLRHHLYKTLVTLVGNKNLDWNSVEVESLWKTIGEAAIGSIMLNQNDSQSHLLLQKLIIKRNLVISNALFESFKLNMLSLTEHSFGAIKTIFHESSYFQQDNRKKIEVLKWILNPSNVSKSYIQPELGEFLVYLCLKQWPEQQINYKKKVRKFAGIEGIYSKDLFLSFVKPEPDSVKEETIDHVDCIDQGMLKSLSEHLTKLKSICDEEKENCDIVKSLWLCLLFTNVLSYLVKYKILSGSVEETNSIFETYSDILRNAFQSLKSINVVTLSNVKQVDEQLSLLNMLFGKYSSQEVTVKLRELVDVDLLKTLFNLSNNKKRKSARQEDSEFVQYSNSNDINISRLATEILTNFCCIPGSGTLTGMQSHVLEVLLDQNAEYKNSVTALNGLKLCKPGYLTLSIHETCCDLFVKLLQNWHDHYNRAVEILQHMRTLFRLLVGDAGALLPNYVNLLATIFERRNKYGPELSVYFLECVAILYKLDPNVEIGEGRTVFTIIEAFLVSDYQRVRFAAIKTIIECFQFQQTDGSIVGFSNQEIAFPKFEQKLSELFHMTGMKPADELAYEEQTLTRSTFILQFYGSITVSCGLWREKAMFGLMRDAKLKELGQYDIASVQLAILFGYERPVLHMLSYLEYMFERWTQTQELDLNKFPYKFFGCDTKLAFYKKYWTTIGCCVLDVDHDFVAEIDRSNEKSVDDLVKECVPKVFGHFLQHKLANGLVGNRFFELATSIISSDLNKSFPEISVDVLFNLITFVHDNGDLERYVRRKVELPKLHNTQINVKQFDEGVELINSLVTVKVEPGFFEKVLCAMPLLLVKLLTRLNVKVYNCRRKEERLLYYYYYIIIAKRIFSCVFLPHNHKIRAFFVRYLIRHLLNFITHITDADLATASAVLLEELVREAIANEWSLLKPLVLILCSNLKEAYTKHKYLSETCMSILSIIIEENTEHFADEIKQLDDFPEEFGRLREIYHGITTRGASLEDEIKHFLNLTEKVDVIGEYEQGLKILRTVMKENKAELLALSEQMHVSKIVQKFIIVLFNLGREVTSWGNVSVLALRCLGEIGPVDFGSLILQPDALPESWTAWELVTGYLISLLSGYLVDTDSNLAEASANALEKIFATKEVKAVLEHDFGFGKICTENVSPFMQIPLNTTSFDWSIRESLLTQFVQSTESWLPKNTSYNSWITSFTKSLLSIFTERAYFSKLAKVCDLKVSFSENILPIIIFAILQKQRTLLIELIDEFFSKYWAIVVDRVEDRNYIVTNKLSLKVMLKVLNFIRLQKCKNMKSCDLRMDFLNVAKAAHDSGEYFTGIFYAEIWCQQVAELNKLGHSSGGSKLDLIYDRLPQAQQLAIHGIFRKGYAVIGESDAFLGCGMKFIVLNPEVRVEHYQQIGASDEVLRFYNNAIQGPSSRLLGPFLQSLNDYSLYMTSFMAFDWSKVDAESSECLWRLSKWDYELPEDKQKSTRSCDYSRFMVLKSMHFDDEFNLRKSIDDLRLNIVNKIKQNNMESNTNTYAILRELKSLEDLEDFVELQCDSGKLLSLVNEWVMVKAAFTDFKYIEPIVSQRMVMIMDYLERHPDNEIGMKLFDLMINLSVRARSEGVAHVSSYILGRTTMIQSLPLESKSRFHLEDAELCWYNKDKVTARACVGVLLNRSDVCIRIKAYAFKLAGQWYAQDHSENSQTILQDYFLKSLSLLDNVPKTADVQKTILDTYDQLAQFADREYQQIDTHIKSDQHQCKVKNMEKTKLTVEDIASKGLDKLNHDQKVALHIRKQLCMIDENETRDLEQKKDLFLRHCLNYYILNLKSCDDNNVRIFRVFSLLLQNRNNEIGKEFLMTGFSQIASYKFICILPQIIPHVSNNQDEFSEAVNKIIEKCAVDHPHHTLPQLLALVNSNKDRIYSPDSKHSTNELRISSAKTLLSKLVRNPKLTSIIKSMQKLSDALIEFAYFQSGVNANNTRTQSIPSSLKIRNIKNLDNVMLPTCNLDVKKDGVYEIVGIQHFVLKFQMVGGKNAPKRINCVGTDGVTRTQLLKGQDDLRQDAVMQQVFTMMNSLLGVNKQTKTLKIRTYKIVPLSKRSGILEWVENSIPLGEYLVGEGNAGAHALYRPNDWSPNECLRKLKNVSTRTNEQKLSVYKQICENFQPVFHKFLQATFPSPTLWYQRRRSYIHSLATSSMGGYILGIGDRHPRNILIDKSTAEVIHIDFGIAFEQGKVLPVPETVPFRLTRDLVDAMGISGVDGVFKRICERTLDVFRSNAETIITIVEVLLYDPLYVWSVNREEANKRQIEEGVLSNVHQLAEHPEENVNVTAERTLLNLRAKLEGTEKGTPLGVDIQVLTLIQEAMNPLNLSRLYYGWQQYL